MIDTQLIGKHEPNNNFKDASLLKGKNNLKASWLDTPLGSIVTVADEDSLYLLEFVERPSLEREIERLKQKIKCPIISGYTQPIHSIETELNQYFEGTLKEFKTPIAFVGSPFRKQVWEELKKIPFGETRSYSDVAKAIGQSSAFRAVAQANGANQLVIIIPCHRVINANGELGGYSAGLTRKKWLLKHENISCENFSN